MREVIKRKIPPVLAYVENLLIQFAKKWLCTYRLLIDNMVGIRGGQS